MDYKPRNEWSHYKVNRENLCEIEAENALNKTSKTWAIRQQQRNQLNYIKIRDFYLRNDVIDKVKRKTKWEKYLQCLKQKRINIYIYEWDNRSGICG